MKNNGKMIVKVVAMKMINLYLGKKDQEEKYHYQMVALISREKE